MHKILLSMLLSMLVTMLFCQAALASRSSEVFIGKQVVEEVAGISFALAGNKSPTLLSAEDVLRIGLPQPVGLTELRNTVEDNELRAETLFPGPFTTSGKIEKVTRVLGTPAVRLTLQGTDEDWRYGTVTAFFASSAVADLATFNTGEWLTVACESWGYSVGVGLKDCVLMSSVAQKWLRQPVRQLKRLCDDDAGKTLILLSLMSEFEVTTPDGYDDYLEALNEDSFHLRTGLIESKDLRQQRNDLLGYLADSPSFKVIGERFDAGTITSEECHSF